jgi:hypothetical protein
MIGIWLKGAPEIECGGALISAKGKMPIKKRFWTNSYYFLIIN